MKKILFSFIVLVTCFWTAVTSAQEVFSKQEAAGLFSMSLEDWKNNAINAKNAGAAGYDTDGDLSHTMFFQAPNGRVVVTPNYSHSNKSKPWKLSVALIFDGFNAALMQSLTDSELKKAHIEDVYKEMLPEFTVFGNIQILDQNTVIHSVDIFEFGYDEIVDQQGAEKLGCFQNCIVRDN